MAKIRNVYIRVDNEDIKKSFNVNITYSAKEKRFEIILPDELKQVVIGFTHQENHDKGLRYKPDYRGNGMDRLCGDYYVIGDTEVLVESKAIEVFTFLNNQQVKRRDVIVIDFQDYDNRHYRDNYNQEHPKIGMQFGLLYCTETKSGESGKPNYTITKTYNGGLNNEFSKVRSKDFASSAVVIDDTEANRLFLENTYSLLSRLINQLSEHCKTPEAILQLISSNQKLIG